MCIKTMAFIMALYKMTSSRQIFSIWLLVTCRRRRRRRRRRRSGDRSVILAKQKRSCQSALKS
jgi:hypothetical protein